ncbi:ferredoxin--NADP reductase [Buchnera aphidicola (Astegopteryx bambusae)]|uniref:ferredoxin--NADP reductase n=1 Tax=Buchnera aphidicola TaxID=9 RepID=UPI0031B83C27
MNNWTTATVVKVKKWKFPLFSLVVNAKILPFKAGQFTKIAIFQNGKKIQRAYSYVNSPKDKNIEFYIAYIEDGILTKKLFNLKIKDKILIHKKSFGFFTIENIPKTKHLWMISTGTAIGPYLSILQHGGKKIKKFKKIILLNAVRYKKHFNYKNIIKKISQKYKNKFIFKKIISREKCEKCLFGRIPNLLLTNKIEKKIKIYINPNDSHIMLCGNPKMLKDTKKILEEKYNLKKHLIKKPGNITMENYW